MNDKPESWPPPLPRAVAWRDGEREIDQVRAARGCPASEILCGFIDGTLWQVSRPLAHQVQRHCTDCGLCRFDQVEFGRTLTARERVVAFWRHVPLVVRALLMVACLALASHHLRVQGQSRATYWRECPVNGRFYFVARGHASYAEALRDAARRGARLAVVRSEAETVWLRDVLCTQFEPGYLIGLREVGLHGNWQWVTGEPLGWAYWEGGQPHRKPDERLRVAMIRHGLWYAVPVPARAGETTFEYAVFERDKPPGSFWEPASRWALACIALALLLLVNLVATLLARRAVMLRMQLELLE